MREAAITRAILVLRGIGDAKTAHAALSTPIGDQLPLAKRDPLAYALDRLLRQRGKNPHGFGPGEEDQPPVHLGDDVRSSSADLPESLGPFERLLSGRPTATSEIWLTDLLPPSQALAAALAMQEVFGTEANWSLLEQYPSFTVPLALMMPTQVVPSK